MQAAHSHRADNMTVIDEAEVRQLSLSERRQLASLLEAIDGPAQSGPAQSGPYRPDPYLANPTLRRQRRLALIALTVCCVILAGWIVVLAATLPHHFDAHHWRALWVDFDVFLLAAFAATAWALWRQRQVVILLLMATGTMLCCDAWFDVGTSLKTSGIWTSLASAVFAELPLAFLAFTGARRLLKATVEATRPAPPAGGSVFPDGTPVSDAAGRGPSLRRTPLSGTGLDEALPRRRAQEQPGRPRQSA
jgi:hypothetical protein